MKEFQGEKIVDPNMDTALQWADEIGPLPPLPSALKKDVLKRAKLVFDINTPLICGNIDKASLLCMLPIEEKKSRLQEIGMKSQNYIPEISNHDAGINISLRLWAGCISAAKTIAHETIGGSNTSPSRKWIFEEKIDPLCEGDPLYKAGVEAAPYFKKLCNQDYSLDGVPPSSAVRNYLDGGNK